MDTFSKQEMNIALLGMYVGTRGPKTLRKCIIDKLFIYQMWRNEETIRENLDAEMVLLAFPESKPVPSLDDLDDLVVPDISSLAFALSKNEQDISKLRNSIRGMLEGPIFQKYLQSREQQFRRKNSRTKLLSRIQFAKLYPGRGESNIYELDITLLCFILFEGMGFRSISDFDKLPLENVITEADDILRIKICRNFLVHQTDAEMSDEDFENYWECLTGAFERLLKNTCVRRESERLKSLRLPDEKIDQFQAMVQGWRMDEQDEQREQLEQMKDIVTRTGLHTDNVIKSTGTKIVENQNEKHEELVTLFKKSSSKRRKVQNKDIKKSFPLRVHGYDKFKQLCHIMHDAGIRYTLPTASSTDTTPTSDSSSSPKSLELQFEVDREDAVDEMSLNLRRSRSLPRYRPRHSIDSGCRASDTANNNLNSPTDSVTHISRVADIRPKRQWKRNASEKSRNSQGNRSPRPGNFIRMGVRSFDERNFTVCDLRTNPEDADAEHESANENPTHRLAPSIGTGRQIPDQIVVSPEDGCDPTGYFLSLQKRDEIIHVNTDTGIEDSQDTSMEQSYGNVYQIVQTRTKSSSTDKCLSIVEEDEDTASLSATSGEYVLGDDDEFLSKNVSEIGDKMRLSTCKSGMYSEDSTGYNTDLLTLSSSVDGNTSSDTLLFQPVRPPVTHRSPSIHGGWSPLMTEKSEQIINSPVNPRTLPIDDGYASNGYFSSLDRNSSTTQDQYGMVGLQKAVHGSTVESFVDRENNDASSQDEANNRELRTQTPEVETLLQVTKQRRRKGFSIGKCFIKCIWCGGKRSDVDQDNSVIVKDNFRRRRESERCLLSSRDSTDISRHTDRIQLPETQCPDRGSQIDNDTDDRRDEFEEIFV